MTKPNIEGHVTDLIDSNPELVGKPMTYLAISRRDDEFYYDVKAMDADGEQVELNQIGSLNEPGNDGIVMIGKGVGSPDESSAYTFDRDTLTEMTSLANEFEDEQVKSSRSAAM